MGLETGTTIAQLNAAWPLGTDPRSQGDDHLRLVKAVVKTDALSKAAGGVVVGGVTVQGTLRVGAGTTSQVIMEGSTNTFFDTNGPSISFRSLLPGLTTLGALAPAGTAATSGGVIMTREKGDFRYALKTTLLAALAALGPGVSPMQLRDAIVDALNAPLEE